MQQELRLIHNLVIDTLISQQLCTNDTGKVCYPNVDLNLDFGQFSTFRKKCFSRRETIKYRLKPCDLITFS